MTAHSFPVWGRPWWRAALRFWLPIALLVVVIYGGLPRNENKAWQLLIAYWLGWAGSRLWAERRASEQRENDWPHWIRSSSRPTPPGA